MIEEQNILESVRRFGWDFHALDAFLELGNLYLHHPKFCSELERLLKVCPRSIDSIDRPGEELATPGDIGQVEQAYCTLWSNFEDSMGTENPWLMEIRDLVREWGLNSPWGLGAVIIWIQSRQWYLRRANGEILSEHLWNTLGWNIRSVPNLARDEPWALAPIPDVDMNRTQWDAEIERFREEGWQLVMALKRAAGTLPSWRANRPELKRHVKWLFERITPP